MIFIVYPIFPYNNVIYFKYKQVYELPKGEIKLNKTINERITLIKNKTNKKYNKLQTINRDFQKLDILLKN